MIRVLRHSTGLVALVLGGVAACSSAPPGEMVVSAPLTEARVDRGQTRDLTPYFNGQLYRVGARVADHRVARRQPSRDDYCYIEETQMGGSIVTQSLCTYEPVTYREEACQVDAAVWREQGGQFMIYVNNPCQIRTDFDGERICVSGNLGAICSGSAAANVFTPPPRW